MTRPAPILADEKEAVRNDSQANGLGPRAHRDIPETSRERDTPPQETQDD